MKDQIFISYSKHDRAFAQKLASDLKASGYDTWFDNSAIQIGQIWREEIVDSIEESRFFLLLLSTHSVCSNNVIKEVSLAENCGKIIFPVLIEEVEIPPGMKYQLAGVQFVRFTKETYQESLELLQKGFREAMQRSDNFLSAILAERGYLLQADLGCSAMAATFLLKDLSRNQLAVLKVSPSTPELQPLYETEAVSLERIRHPCVPRLLDRFESSGWYCLVQEYIVGKPWHGPSSGEPIKAMVLNVLGILRAVHEAGVIHGDVHPSNLIVSSGDQRLFLADLSLFRTKFATLDRFPKARSDLRDIRQKLTISSFKLPIQKLFFQAPELTRFSQLTPAVDLYALGVTALSLYTGLEPSLLYDHTLATWNLERVDSSMRPWMAALLEESPARRVSSADEALALINGHRGKTQSQVPAPIDPRSVELPPSKNLEPLEKPSSLTPVSTKLTSLAASGLPCLSKDTLIENLLLRFGPVIHVLLEPWPASLSETHLDEIRATLLTSGLDLQSLEEAFAASLSAWQGVTPSELPTAVPESSVTLKTLAVAPPVANPLPVQDPPSDPAQKLEDLYKLLSSEIGPVAELVWSDELRSALLHDSDRARSLLASQAVPERSISDLLEAAGYSSSEVTTRNSDRHSPSEPGKSEPVLPLAQPALREVLLETVGPMGDLLLSRLTTSELSPTELLKSLERELVRYGVATEVLGEIRRRLGPWAGE